MASLSQRNIDVTELDFDKIKDTLISYYKKSDSPFKDWDYSGAGLNQLLDVLAYNTHYNAVLAHMSINETFLDTAQLRSSVISNAKLLGYTPSSVSSPSAIINLSFVAKPYANGRFKKYITLPSGTQFISNIEGITHIFTTQGGHILYRDPIATSPTFNRYIGDVTIHEGFIKKKTFQINNLVDRPVYEIDDENIDITTMSVKVFDSPNTTSYNVYSRFNNVSSIEAASRIYFINENAVGKYEFYFGNGVFGVRPTNLGIVEIEYISTKGATANGANVFQYAANPEILGTMPHPTITLVSAAAGGASRESIENIRYNAPRSLLSQNRAVTADDYKNIINDSFTGAHSISVWGGEENVPPRYGKVYISIKPNQGLYLNDTDKKTIYEILKPKKVLSIMPELIDPDYVNISLDVLFKYNKNITTLSPNEIELSVRNLINKFNNEQMLSFDKVFRHSLLLKTIDSSNPAILNSHVRVYVSKTTTLIQDSIAVIYLNFGTQLQPDDGNTISYCSPWQYGGNYYYLGDSADPTNADRRILHTYYIQDGVRYIVNRDAGSLILSTGEMLIKPVAINGTQDIIIECIPISNDIAPRRNQILNIDMASLNVYSEIDTIAVGGSAAISTYTTFKRDR